MVPAVLCQAQDEYTATTMASSSSRRTERTTSTTRRRSSNNNNAHYMKRSSSSSKSASIDKNKHNSTSNRSTDTDDNASASTPLVANIHHIVTKRGIRSLLHDYFEDHDSLAKASAECWRVFYEKYHAPNYILIRPSGNPIDAEGFITFVTSGILEIIQAKLVQIESIQILAGGAAAVVTYTVDQTFKFQGTPNEDRTKVTCVVEERDGQLKIAHEHRSPGTPLPKASRWDTNHKQETKETPTASTNDSNASIRPPTPTSSSNSVSHKISTPTPTTTTQSANKPSRSSSTTTKPSRWDVDESRPKGHSSFSSSTSKSHFNSNNHNNSSSHSSGIQIRQDDDDDDSDGTTSRRNSSYSDPSKTNCMAIRRKSSDLSLSSSSSLQDKERG